MDSDAIPWIDDFSATERGGPALEVDEVDEADDVGYDDPEPGADLGSQLRAGLVHGGDGKSFLPLDALHLLLTPEAIRRELNRACPDMHGLDYLVFKILAATPLPFSEWEPEPKLASYRKIFAILVFIERTARIKDFLDENVQDYDLPLVLSSVEGAQSLKRTMHRRGELSKPLRLFDGWSSFAIESFDMYQWRLIAPYFAWPEKGQLKAPHYDFSPQTILPFVEFEPNADRGGYSSVQRVKLHTAHYNFGASFGSNSYIAVKRLHSTSREIFEEEVRALQLLGNTQELHVIKLLATFSYRDDYYLLFPWADGNLSSFWKLNQPTEYKHMPSWVVSQFLGLSDALRAIHHLNIREYSNKTAPSFLVSGDSGQSMGPDTPLLGRHGDIKPENILWFKGTEGGTKLGDGDSASVGTLRLSDFGLTRFHSIQSGTKERAHGVAVSPTYRPPEVDVSPTISRSLDIWSLGCVFLESIVWLVQGRDEIDRFSEERTLSEHENMVREDKFFELDPAKPGAVLKDAVRKKMNYLATDSRSSPCLVDLLGLIRSSMLRIDPGNRASIGKIVDKLGSIHRRCQVDSHYTAWFGPVYGNDQFKEDETKILLEQDTSSTEHSLGPSKQEFSATRPESWPTFRADPLGVGRHSSTASLREATLSVPESWPNITTAIIPALAHGHDHMEPSQRKDEAESVSHPFYETESRSRDGSRRQSQQSDSELRKTPPAGDPKTSSTDLRDSNGAPSLRAQNEPRPVKRPSSLRRFLLGFSRKTKLIDSVGRSG